MSDKQGIVETGKRAWRKYRDTLQDATERAALKVFSKVEGEEMARREKAAIDAARAGHLWEGVKLGAKQGCEVDKEMYRRARARIARLLGLGNGQSR